ncbi:tetratricopeptide repeat protein [Streptosporangium sp. NPDC002544]|uniref:tetratricopeptide repeat protein n=1 Tax=Streptosporangium sp. NPDC002544 TaxID=3154538 RepID=UPI00332183DB
MTDQRRSSREKPPVAVSAVVADFTARPPVREQIVEGAVPAPPAGFQVREDLLAQLAATEAVCALTGAPGVGKTLLAASYAWACQAAGWPVVAWIPAATTDQILAGLEDLAHRLGVRVPVDTIESASDKAKAWLSGTHQPCLVVFDGATDIQAVRRWCPAGGAARVVITSRDRAFGDHYASMEVDAFTPAQAVAFLAGRTGLADEDAAAELAEELGRLPLALAQAGAVIAREKTGYRGYLRSLRDLSPDRQLTALADDGYPAGVAQAVLVSLCHAEEAVAGARPVLERLAVLSSFGVARSLLPGGAEPGKRSGVDELLSGLADTSLITFSDDGRVVLMHGLIQRVLRERARHDDRLGQVLADAVGPLRALNDLINEETTPWKARGMAKSLREHIGVLHATASPVGLLTPDLLLLRGWSGDYLREMGDLSRAITLHEVTLAESERLLGTDHPATLSSRHDLACSYQAAERAQETIALFEQVLAERERVLGVDHLDTLTSRQVLAYTYQWGERTQEAITLYERAVADCERVLGSDHHLTLGTRHDLADTYRAAGRTREAITLFEQVLPDCERVLGRDHVFSLASRHNLADAHQLEGRPQKAVTLYEQLLPDCERALGRDHLLTLTTRGNLSGAYRAAGRTQRAITSYEAMLTDCELLLDADAPLTLTGRHNLAEIYLEAGRLREAIALYERVVAERERTLGADHLDTLTSRHHLAYAHDSAGRTREAIAMFKRVLADCERVLGADHPNTRAARESIDNVRSFLPRWRRLIGR